MFVKLLTFLSFSIAILCSSISKDKKGKIFNLFAMVRFRNDDCRGDALQNPESLIGTCYTSSECTDRAGRAVGNCASGFGICCVFDSFMCGDTISQNKSYIRSPNYPSNFIIDQAYIEQYKVNNTGATCTSTEFKCQEPGNSSICITQDFVNDKISNCEDKSDEFVRCKFNVKKSGDGVCSLRLDFESFTLLAGAGSTDLNSVCQDEFEISNLVNGNFRVPIICGYNTGEHIYLDIGNKVNDLTGFAATIDIRFGLLIGTRLFSIRVSQHSCSSKNTPPGECLQYFTGSTGRLTTFNFNNDVNSAHLHSQDYAICIRREFGNCCIEYSVCEDPNSFSIDNTRYELFTFMSEVTAAVTAAIAANGTMAAVEEATAKENAAKIAPMNLLASSTCTRDWIEINDSSEECNGNLQYNKYCGFIFSTDIASETDQDLNNNNQDLSEILKRPHRTICDCTPPFNVGVRTSNEFRGVPPVPVANIRGQKWDQEEPTLQAKGVCLNYKQTLCA